MIASAPGRVNIIGEHVDYCDGFVLPFAVNRRTKVKVSPSERFEIISKGYGKVLLEKLEKASSWADYVIGVLVYIEELRGELVPLRLEIESNLPVGAGLSSSAALEVATAKAVDEMLGLGLSEWDILQVSLKAEREFVGVNCGIMDQYTTIYAKKGFALLIDTMKETHEYIPLNLRDAVLAIVESGVKHELASGEYNKRRAETGAVLKELGKKSYRDLTMKDVSKLSDAVLKKRAEHVLSEIQRTLEASKALKEGDVQRLGELLYESHESLSKLYEVSCEESDFIVGFFKDCGAIGARMVGGGFGGGILVLWKEEDIEECFKKLESVYRKKFNAIPDLLKVESDDGVKVETE